MEGEGGFLENIMSRSLKPIFLRTTQAHVQEH